MRKSNSIDTLRLRVLHTACTTVDEIADKMNITVDEAEYELKKMGYTPIYKHDTQECHGFIKKEENNMVQKPRIPDEKKQEIVTLKAEGKSIKEITEATGVSKSTVRRVWLDKTFAETKEEPAPSVNDTSSKGVNEKNIFTNNIIPEIPADVNPCEEVSDENFCCEVTGDTDMEAYLADRKKVSTREAIPEAVVEACVEKRTTLLGELEDIKIQIREIEEFLGIDREGRE